MMPTTCPWSSTSRWCVAWTRISSAHSTSVARGEIAGTSRRIASLIGRAPPRPRAITPAARAPRDQPGGQVALGDEADGAPALLDRDGADALDVHQAGRVAARSP